MTEIFALLTTLPHVPKPLNKLPGCYERDLPDGWHVSINAHPGAFKHVPPYHALFTHAAEMSMALVSAHGGQALGVGVEERIIAALKAAGATVE